MLLTTVLSARVAKVGLCATESWSSHSTLVTLFPAPTITMNGFSYGIFIFSLYLFSRKQYIEEKNVTKHFRIYLISLESILMWLHWPVKTSFNVDEEPMTIVDWDRINSFLYCREISMARLIYEHLLLVHSVWFSFYEMK